MIRQTKNYNLGRCLFWCFKNTLQEIQPQLRQQRNLLIKNVAHIKYASQRALKPK